MSRAGVQIRRQLRKMRRLADLRGTQTKMDSLTQMTLGSAVGVAVMGRRVPVWRSALVGAFFGTLPDLDSFVDYGDPIRNVTYHRGASHSLF